MTSLLVRDACFAASCPNYATRQWEPAPPLRKIPHLYFVDPLEGRDREGRPVPVDLFIDVSRVFATKRAMLACHASQRNWLLRQHGIDEYLEMQARWGASRGAEIGVAQAEAFRQYRGHPYPHDNILPRLTSDALRDRLSGIGREQGALQDVVAEFGTVPIFGSEALSVPEPDCIPPGYDRSTSERALRGDRRDDRRLRDLSLEVHGGQSTRAVVVEGSASNIDRGLQLPGVRSAALDVPIELR